jgi:hypothetical protein
MRLICRCCIALLEIGGGAVGAGWCGWAMLNRGGTSLLLLLFTCLYALSIVAGVALLRNRSPGVPLSMLVQAVQVPQIETARISYLFVSGLGAWLEVGTTGIGFHYALASRFHVAITTGWGPPIERTPVLIGVNLIAALALAYLVFDGYRRLTATSVSDAG